MNESPDASEGKAYRQSPDGPDLAESTGGRGRRIFMSIVILIGLGALGFAVYALVKHLAIPKWEAPAFAAAGVIVALLGAVGMGGRKSSAYRFDSSSSRALSTLGRMHDKK